MSNNLSNTLKLLWNDDVGQDLTEYVLLLALIVLISVAGIGAVGQAVSTAFSKAASNLTSAT